MSYPRTLGLLAAFVEMLRVILTAILKRRDGAWFVGSGFIVLFLALAFTFPQLSGGVNPRFDLLGYGSLGLLIPMSVYLARNVARTSRDLEVQLDQVRELSAKTVEQERALRQDMEKELQTAHDLQMGLMPRAAPATAGCASAGRCLPATQVGGDFFQYYHSPEHLSVGLADVTGHAMEAAIPAVVFSGILDSQMHMGGQLAALFARLNTVLCNRLTGRTHVTFSLSELDLVRRSMRFANAGCPYPCHYRHATADVAEIVLDAYPLGIRPDTVYRTVDTQLSPGDYVVIYSDGIAEAANVAGRPLDRRRPDIRRPGAPGR